VKHHQGHVVMLLGARDEGVGRGKNALQDLLCAEAIAAFDGLHQAIFAPLFIRIVHGLADAIGERHEEVTGAVETAPC